MSVDKHTVSVSVILASSLLSDLLITAVESGSGYWATDLEITKAGKSVSYQAPDLFSDEADWELKVADREDGETFTAKREHFINAVRKMPAHHIRNMTEDGFDSETADAWFQCAIFGEIVFG